MEKENIPSDTPGGKEDSWSTEEITSSKVALVTLGDGKKEPSKPWAEKDWRERCESVAWAVAKTCGLLLLLYIFVCSLDLLSRSLQLLAGRTTGQIFENDLLTNPVVGLMIGILSTVLVQSSSTSTSIIVSMVAANIFDIPTAIPMIMGANVGTSVTNTLVAVTRINNRAEFGRAFAGATVHDMFNWLTVIVLLIVEVTTGYLYHVTTAIMNAMFHNYEGTNSELELIQVITDPLTDSVLLLDDDVLHGWALQNSSYDNATLLKIYCDGEICPSLFSHIAWSDTTTGAVMTVVSLLILCGCLITLVKLLQNVLQGPMAHLIQKTVNADIPYVPWLTGYLAMLVGAIATFLLQSSSVFTSALTPLVGMGIITVERVYPLTLGSNIGTTTTAILAALAAPSQTLPLAIQAALCHLFFNITGILIFYPIPFMRWPIPMSKVMGTTTAKYRWFAIAYLLFAFLLIPAVILGLTIADPSGYTLLGVGVVVVLIILFVVVMNVMQKHFSNVLPEKLRTWEWLPLCLRSLEPVDSVLTKTAVCCRCTKPSVSDVTDDVENGPRKSESQDQQTVDIFS